MIKPLVIDEIFRHFSTDFVDTKQTQCLMSPFKKLKRLRKSLPKKFLGVSSRASENIGWLSFVLN